MLTASSKYARVRSADATSTESVAHSTSAYAARRRARSAWSPATTVRGSKTLRPAVSRTTRRTASGRSSAASASQADSMSTASTPSPSSARRSSGLMIFATQKIVPVCARRPRRRTAAASASRARHGDRVAVLASQLCRADDVARAKLGRDGAADAGDRDSRALDGESSGGRDARARRAHAGAQHRPTGTFGSAAASRRSGGEHEQIAHSRLPRTRPSAITGKTCR